MDYCNALLLLLVAFEIQVDPTGKSKVGRVYRFYLYERACLGNSFSQS